MVIEKARNLIKSSKLFDSEWYKKKYPDVVFSKLSPIDHYIKYGTLLDRDPGPDFSSFFYSKIYLNEHELKLNSFNFNPLLHFIENEKNGSLNLNKVLFACDKLMDKGNRAQSINLASKFLPNHLRHTLKILLANNAIFEENKLSWLKNINSYLSHFGVTPIALNKRESLLDSLIVSDPLNSVHQGPKISVIMPVWNSENTVSASIRSILNQTWRNLELIIIDDASDDQTWTICEKFAKQDNRIKLYRNIFNKGPYFCKNIALNNFVSGEYITGQDADDWSHPQRLEHHYFLSKEHGALASIIYMLRLSENGQITKIDVINDFSFDGAARKASISCLFNTQFLKDELGYWDNVRFGADTEMLARAQHASKGRFSQFRFIGMLCMDLPSSLTNDPITGIKVEGKGLSKARLEYKEKWTKDHLCRSKNNNWYVGFFEKASHQLKT